MMSEVSFRGFFRAASISAILAGVFLAAGITLAIASSISLDASGDELLARIHAHRFLFVTSIGAFLVSGIFTIPLMPALYLALKEVQHTYALLSLTVGVTGVMSNLTDNILSYSLARLSERFSASDGVGKIASAAAADAILSSSRVAFALTLLLFGAGTFIISWAMLKATFPRLLSGLGIVTGISSIIGGMLLPVFFLAVIPSNVLYIIWFIGLGYTLYRRR